MIPLGTDYVTRQNSNDFNFKRERGEGERESHNQRQTERRVCIVELKQSPFTISKVIETTLNSPSKRKGLNI